MTRLQSVDPIAELRQQMDDLNDRLREQQQSPWLTSAEACDYLRYTGKHRLIALYRYLKRKGIATARRERRLLIAKADLQRSMGVRRHG